MKDTTLALYVRNHSSMNMSSKDTCRIPVIVLSHDIASASCHLKIGTSGINGISSYDLDPGITTNEQQKLPSDCRICGSSFTSPEQLQAHYTDVSNHGFNTICKYCGKWFRSFSGCRDHCKMEHASGSCVQCRICGKKFPHRHRLATHMKVHSNDRPFKCQICPMTFKHKHILHRHELSCLDRK